LVSIDEKYKGYLAEAAHLVNKTPRRETTFLCGKAGSLAIASVLHSSLGDEDRSDSKISELLGLQNEVMKNTASEHLYGHAGYLFSLLFVRHHLETKRIPDSVIQKMCELILDIGKEGSKRTPHLNSPLVYTWHGKLYVGAAHGISGILHTLMEVPHLSPVSEHLESHIKPTLDYILSLKFKSNNFPSSVTNTTDRLVQWCHGAPGLALTFSRAYEIFKDERYLSAAQECTEVTWQRGLLRKGYGLCHGAAGNAYAFLAVYRATKDPKYLYRAMKFGEWCMSSNARETRTPDRPYSLFEGNFCDTCILFTRQSVDKIFLGLAGTIYYYCDLLKPEMAAFPAFSLS
jgi:lantibiotic modifying enzyme